MALKVDIFTRNLDLTDQLKEYINKKVSKLDRFLPGIDETRVDLAYAKSARNAADRQVAQITIRGRGFILRTEERADDMFAAIDLSLDKMQRMIERFKGKRHRGRAEGTPATSLAVEAATAVETEPTPVIVRRKQFTLVPMDEAEAIEQMNLLGHEDFFIFFNVNSNSINVLYRRRDGAYGLIEPKIG